MTLWLKVSKDKYALPLAVADTARELAEMCDTSINAIYSSVCHFNNSGKWGSYRKIEVEED